MMFPGNIQVTHCSMPITGSSYNRPYGTPPNPPPRKYGKAYYNPSMLDNDEDPGGDYPIPTPRSNRKPDHPLLRTDSSMYQVKGSGVSLR